MITRYKTLKRAFAICFAGLVAPTAAQTGGSYDLSWSTVDGGGGTFSTGGVYSLGGTIGQPDAGAMTGGAYSITGGFWPAATASGASNVTIAAANPPTDNPYVAGQQPFLDVLDTGTGRGLSAGIGGAGTPAQGTIVYAPIVVSFSAAPTPAPSPGTISLSCTGGACPTVTAVTGAGAGPYNISLSAPIPPGQCTTFTFAGTAAGQKLHYRSQPGNVSMDALTSTQDLLALVQALNNGDANLLANLPRYNVNRSTGPTPVNTQDLLRIVQLLNGTNTTQPFNGTGVAACP